MMILKLQRFIGKDEPCVQCGREHVALQGVEHNGWCWWCISNRMQGRGYDSYGHPF